MCVWETRKYAQELDESNHERLVCVCVRVCVRVCVCNTFLFRVADVRVEEASVCVCVCVCVQRESLSFLCQKVIKYRSQSRSVADRRAKYVIHMTKCENKC